MNEFLFSKFLAFFQLNLFVYFIIRTNSYSLQTGSNQLYEFKWFPLNQNLINFELCLNLTQISSAPDLKLFGFGFGTNDLPIKSDLYLILLPKIELFEQSSWADNSQFVEAYTDEDTKVYFREKNPVHSPVKSAEIILKLEENHHETPQLCLNLTRDILTCEKNGYIINNQTTRLFLFHDYYNLNYPDLYSTNSFMKWSKHIQPIWLFNKYLNIWLSQIDHVMLPVQLIKSLQNNVVLPEEEVQIFETHVTDVEIPNVPTTYWCKTAKLPNLYRKHHIIRYEGVITPSSEGKVHHMEVFRCVGKSKVPNFNGPCNSEVKPMGLTQCRNVIGAWAIGATGLTLPKQAGFAIGNVDEPETIVIEIHYTNPKQETGFIDNSGIRFYITSKLREYDAGIIELGLTYTPRNIIPPKQSSFTLSGYCDSQCTQLGFPKNGIQVFASQLHTHGTGKKVVTYHLRNGTRLPDLNRDDQYSPHFQEIRQLSEPVHIKQGDTLITKCTYNSMNRDQVTLGGIGQQDEMCLNYIFYYPQSEIELCKSDVSLPVLNLFLNILENSINLSKNFNYYKESEFNLEHRFHKINWTDRNVQLLTNLYRISPIEMHCNSSSGSRIKNSDIYRFPSEIPKSTTQFIGSKC